MTEMATFRASNPDDFPPPAPVIDPVAQLQANETSQHPVALFFHVIFKGLSIFFFLFGTLFTNSFIITFITCVLLCAFDFWTVKNVTGRLLVGLRWWNEILEDGSTKWIFESKPQHRLVSTADSRFFWTALSVTPAIWLVLGIVFTGLQIKWLLIVIVALVLSTANLIGYWKCQGDASEKLRSAIAGGLISAATSNLMTQQSSTGNPPAART